MKKRDELESLRARVSNWSLNDGSARISVPLRELRAALDRLSAQQREPEPPTSGAIADVSVDELADWLLNNFSLNADHKADARALLARYKIERLDRLASGRR